MGHELYRMIRYGAPPDWTQVMRLVAGMIADDARDPTQGSPDDGGWPWSVIRICGDWDDGGEWHDGLTEQTGMSERAISRALADLAAAGYEMRERVGTDRRGRPVFAYRGHAMRFRVPLLAPRKPPERSPDSATFTGERSPSTATERRVKGRQIRRERSPNLASKVAESGDPISPDPPNSPPTAKSSAVNSPVEGSHRAREQDQDFSDDGGKGICSVCGQRVELKRSMKGPYIDNHQRDRKGESYCPGTGFPAATYHRRDDSE